MNHKQGLFAVAPRRLDLLDELVQGFRNGLASMCDVNLPHGSKLE